MKFLLELFDGEVSLAPTHAPLIDKLGGTLIAMPGESYAAWLAGFQTMWTELAAGGALSADVAMLVDSTAAYVRETGADFVETSAAVAAFGPPSEEDLFLAGYLAPMLPSVLDEMRLPPPLTPQQRFDAYSRMLDRHAVRAYDRSVGRQRSAAPNHAIDVNLLQHLAEGVVVVTRDYELIEEVDACGSPQAPWVRTAGELLAGRFPSGAPFGYSATLAKKKHRARNAANLRRLDEEQMRLLTPAKGPI